MREIPEDIGNFISYDPETGVMIRVRDCGKRGKIGCPVGSVSTKGRLHLSFRDITYAGHRVAWFLMTGEQPPPIIDHADLNPLNNRWSNLRAATTSLNAANQRSRRNGPKGVTLHGSGRFQAQIKKNGKTHYLGLFGTESDAASAYASKASELFGDFARSS